MVGKDVGPVGFSSLFQNLRLREGLTQKEVADILGVSPSTVSRVERGKRNPPRSAIVYERMNAVPGWSEEDIATLTWASGTEGHKNLRLPRRNNDPSFCGTYHTQNGYDVDIFIRAKPNTPAMQDVPALRQQVRTQLQKSSIIGE